MDRLQKTLEDMIYDSDAVIDDSGRVYLYDFEKEITEIAEKYASLKCAVLASELRAKLQILTMDDSLTKYLNSVIKARSISPNTNTNID